MAACAKQEKRKDQCKRSRREEKRYQYDEYATKTQEAPVVGEPLEMKNVLVQKTDIDATRTDAETENSIPEKEWSR